jgi:hypothetical protein
MPGITQAASLTCAEDIALLSLLYPVAAPPSSNLTENLPIDRKRHTLPFDRERSLAGTLAFIANIKDDLDHIPEHYLQESPGSTYECPPSSK